jgi:uncharacterized protein (DUF952 family)/lysophospholipase L1-like esterase
MAFQRFVAIGDSQTEGLNDPDGRGGFRGWADRFADLLVAEHPHLQYANLAIRGRTIGAIRAEQLARALALGPDLATVMGGLNDLMRPRVDVSAVIADLDAMLVALRATGATVVTNTFPDPSPLAPLFRRLAPRVAAYNELIRAAAAACGALVVDFGALGVGSDLRIWSRDRIHANPLGHSLIAAAFADTVGLPGFGGWADPLPPAPRVTALRRTGTELRWLGGDVAPWALRHARGRSSGDGITAKRPDLVPVANLFHIVAPADWPATGRYRPPSLAGQGFVHFSFADQVDGPANALYAAAEELIVIEIDPGAVDAPIRVEDSYGAGLEFPHVYGPVPVSAAVAVHPLRRDSEGAWRFSPGAAGVGASPGH